MPARRRGDQDADTEGRGPAHQTGRPADKAHLTASEEPGPREPPAGGKTTRAEAPATTARVRAAKRARGGPGNDEARTTRAEGQHERTAASTPGAQPTRNEPPAARTAETTGATGNGEPCREPAKATTPERGNECALEEIMFCPPGGERVRGGGDVKGRSRPVWRPLTRNGQRSCPRRRAIASLWRAKRVRTRAVGKRWESAGHLRLVGGVPAFGRLSVFATSRFPWSFD
jgi:hypothetical protein